MVHKSRKDLASEANALRAAYRATGDAYDEAARLRAKHFLESALDDLGRGAVERDRPRPAPRPSRPLAWRGPHVGKTFATAPALERAVLETCVAGLSETFGASFRLEELRMVFAPDDPSVDPGPDADEKRARELYADLRGAIDDAVGHARAHLYATGAAGAALRALWRTTLPAPLPTVEELPGYTRQRRPRGALVDRWQVLAQQAIGRDLSARELAEVSMVLGVGPGLSYEEMMNRSPRAGGKWTVSQVLDYEATRMDRARKSPRRA